MVRIVNLAVNPLPWVIGPNGFTVTVPVLTEAMAALGRAGFSALHADIPEDMSPDAYKELLQAHGFAPAPGYFSASFRDRSDHAKSAENAKRHAARQAALGLTESFIAHDLTTSRMERPAIGFGSDPAVTATVAEGLALAAEAGKTEGITYALHPHVGSQVETEEEIRSILDATEGSPLAFGPDIGHLRWAGITPQTLISDYASRIAAVHLKDVDAAGRDTALATGAPYFPATMEHHVWTEPGRGIVDFDAVFAAIPDSFEGWFVVEVDVPNLSTPFESAQAAYEFLAPRYVAGVIA